MPLFAGTLISTPLTRRFDWWLTNIVERSPKTVTQYVAVIERLVGALEADTLAAAPADIPKMAGPRHERFTTDGDLDWSLIGLDDLERHVAAWVKEKSCEPSSATKRKRVYALRAWYDFLEGRGEVDANLARHLRAPAMKKRRPRPIPDDSWLALWGSPLGVVERVWLGLGFYAGFRREEMVQVEVAHFDFDGRRVTDFPRKGSKEGDVLYGALMDLMRERLPQLHPTAVEWEQHLRWLANERRGERLLLPVGDDGYTHAVNRINHRMNRIAPDFVPHQLRHSFGTNCFRMGLPIEVVADQMSHTSIETTRGYIDTAQRFAELVDRDRGGLSM